MDTNRKKTQLEEAEDTIVRLRRELEFARQETQSLLSEAREQQEQQYHLELESSKKRNESERLKVQAEEVAKRRKAEKEVFRLKGELQAAREELSRLQLQTEEAKQQLTEIRDRSRLEAQEEVNKIRAQAKEAWRHAEEETARLDEELAETKQLLKKEKDRRFTAEALVQELESALKAQTGGKDEVVERDRYNALVKKAHTTIQKLETALKNVTKERDEFLDELNEYRASYMDETLEKQVQQNRSGSSNIESDKVVKLSGDKYEKSKVQKSNPLDAVNLSQNVIEDQISDELLMLEPDMSLDDDLHGDYEQKPARRAPPHLDDFLLDDEDDDIFVATSVSSHQNQSVSDIAKELLTEKSVQTESADVAKSIRARMQAEQPDSAPSRNWLKIVVGIVFAGLVIGGGFFGYKIYMTKPGKAVVSQTATTIPKTPPAKVGQMTSPAPILKQTSPVSAAAPVDQAPDRIVTPPAPPVKQPPTTPSQTAELPKSAPAQSTPVVSKADQDAFLLRRMDEEQRLRFAAEQKMREALLKEMESIPFSSTR